MVYGASAKNMLLRVLATTATALMLSTVSLLKAQVPAIAGSESVPLTSAQAQGLSRDLTRSSSQDFFVQGHEQLEREIQILSQKRLTTPVLRINVAPAKGDVPPRVR